MARHWYVATVKPRGERLAEWELRKQNLRAINLRCRVSWPKPCGGERYRILPYLQSYILINFDAERDRWQAINSTRGVRRLLMGASLVPHRIRRGVVEALLATCDGGESFVSDERLDEVLHRKVGVGDNITVGGVELPVVKQSGHSRVGVMLDILGRKVFAPASGFTVVA